MKLSEIFSSRRQARHLQAPASTPTNEQAPPKSWQSAQSYELDHAIAFMRGDHFNGVYAQWLAGETSISNGYVNPLMLREFFNEDIDAWADFLRHISGKSCMDIGPCVFSALASWDVCARRIAVEPLAEKIIAWQRQHLGTSTFDGIAVEPCPAEIFLAHHNACIDGALVCRNMLDHTPEWPFVLGNIARYCTKGCHLLLWTDVWHHGKADSGHFEITRNPLRLKGLIEALGFEVVFEYTDRARTETNWGCRAVKQ